MAPTTHAQSIRLSITRLRRGVILCCWLVGLALACQALIWSLASYTQIRHVAAASSEPSIQPPPVVLKSEQQPAPRGRILAPPEPVEETAPEPAAAVEPVTPRYSHHDRWMAAAFDLAGGMGRLAVIVLVVALGLGVALGASAAVPGTERAVLAFLWAALVALLVLPLGRPLHLPWADGALTTYAHMSSWVDQIEANRAAVLAGGEIDEAAPSSLLSHARFLLLPVACIVGVVLIGLRFSVAVETAVLRRESMKLDPILEREASNISPTSLHGPRGSNMVSRTIAPEVESEPVAVSRGSDDGPPKRLI